MMISQLLISDLPPKRYVLDANIFIAAWHDRYPIDVCPGFWKCLHIFAHQDTLLSIDKVREEIKGPDELVRWIKGNWSRSFSSTQTPDIAKVYAQLQQWAQDSSQFQAAAKEEFARVADGWLVAYARVNGCILVTNEVYKPHIMRRVPLPNVCKQFGIEYCNTVEMLRQLGVTFDWRSPP